MLNRFIFVHLDDILRTSETCQSCATETLGKLSTKQKSVNSMLQLLPCWESLLSITEVFGQQNLFLSPGTPIYCGSSMPLTQLRHRYVSIYGRSQFPASLVC